MRSPPEQSLVASIADDLPAGIWVAAARDGEFVYANRAFDEIMGMGPVPEAGVGDFTAPYGIYGLDGRLYPEDQLPFVRALRARATVVVDDLVIHRRDGRRVYVRAFGKPIFDLAGEISHVAIVFFDITRELEAERARALAERQLRTVVANTPVVLFACDRDGTIAIAEGRGLAGLGATPADLRGRSVFDLYPDAPAVARMVRQALDGETVSTTVELRSVVFEVWLAPSRDERGEIVGAIGVSTDITERQRIAGRLAQAERLASVGMLAAGVAHEINNPLAYVVGSLDLMARELGRETPDRAALEGMIRHARGGAERVRAIVRDLTAFSRGEERPASAADIARALEGALEIAREEIARRARLVVRLEPVPAVLADEGRLGQVFVNLLVNAAQAIGAGAPDDNEVRVALSTAPDGKVAIEVADTGAGIAPEALPKIFDPFFTTKPLGVGTGLGLSICHAIVTDVGGTIEVESTPGRGATFRVLLPPFTAETRPIDRRPPPRGRVLVVDDEPLILQVVSALLASEHEVVCEASALEALLRVSRGERFDAIVCDLMMPAMTGMELHQRLHALAPATAERMLFLTGGAVSERARAFVARVSNTTLEKPFDGDELARLVRALVAAR